MLVNLHIKNFAIIKEIDIEFEEGLNVLSGETGTGKSLILKAVSFLKGERFNKDYLGKFSDKTVIEAIFTTNEKLDSILIENGFEVNENIIISRTFTDSSSISKINNRASNIKILSQITDLLFDIHGQHSQLIVLNKSNYIDLIDKFEPSTKNIKLNLAKNLKEIDKLIIKKSQLNLTDDKIEREKDLLKYQINEIERFDFDNYDEVKLNNEYRKLSNQTALIKGTDNIITAINDSNRSDSFFDMSSSIYNMSVDLSILDPEFTEITSDALNIRELIRDLSNKVEQYSYTLEVDDERLSIIESIFSDFQNLKLKYGRNEEEIIEFLKSIKQRYNELANITKNLENIDKKINELNKENIKSSNDLTLIRSEIIKNLEYSIISELKQMNMQHINFKISMEKLEKIRYSGQDDIDFLISTNKGQELKSLSQVSSGGEISRFMLALKSTFIDKDDIGTIIFDEIDTGISGKTADIVGDKIKDISLNTQLLVISHLPQIASKATHHYLIEKNINGNNTVTSIKKLGKNDRIKEIARLISGSNITNNSIESAKELLGG